jgi:hypothetical protein
LKSNKAVAVPILLYGTETWVKNKNVGKIQAPEIKFLKSVRVKVSCPTTCHGGT